MHRGRPLWSHWILSAKTFLIAWVVVTHAVSGLAQAQPTPSFQVSAGIRFLAPDRAELRWESNLEGPASVAYGNTRKLGTVLESAESGTSHSVVLDHLSPGEAVFYRVGVRHGGRRYMSPFFSVEAGMNYSVSEIPLLANRPRGIDQVIGELNQPGGMAIVVQTLASTWARPLAERSQMTVIAACDDRQSLQQTRAAWYDDGVYGVRMSAQLAVDVPDGIANVVVTDVTQLPHVTRWLSPSGQLVCLADVVPPLQSLPSGSIQWELADDGIWIGQQRGLESLAVWGHQYGSTDNASYVGETLGGADETDELTIRWLGRPGADFGIDRNPRMPAPLAIGGRLFHQGHEPDDGDRCVQWRDSLDAGDA